MQRLQQGQAPSHQDVNESNVLPNQHDLHELRQQPVLGAPQSSAALPEPADSGSAHQDSSRRDGGLVVPHASQSLPYGNRSTASKETPAADSPPVQSAASSSGPSSSSSSRKALRLPTSSKKTRAASSKGSGVAAAIAPLLQAMQGLVAITGVSIELSPLLEMQTAPFLRQPRPGSKGKPVKQPFSHPAASNSAVPVQPGRQSNHRCGSAIPRPAQWASMAAAYMSTAARRTNGCLS